MRNLWVVVRRILLNTCSIEKRLTELETKQNVILQNQLKQLANEQEILLSLKPGPALSLVLTLGTPRPQ